MPKLNDSQRLLIIALLVLAASVFIVETSETFTSCLYGKYQEKREQTLRKSIADFPIWFGQRQECLGVFVHKNEGAITALSTLIIAVFTWTLWWANRIQTKHTREVERAYISGGGPLSRNDPGILCFTVDNYGKTPAVMLEYVVTFCPLNNIPPTPIYDRIGFPRTTFTDRIPPGTMGRHINNISIPNNIPRPLLAYGRYWFLDIWEDEHSSGFVLLIEAAGTHGHVPAGIPRRYIDWD